MQGPRVAPALLLLLGLVAAQAHGHHNKGKEWVVNDPQDSATPAESCGGSCNLRTAWSLAGGGDTITIKVNPLMEYTIYGPPGGNMSHPAPLTINGDVKSNNDGGAIIYPETKGFGFLRVDNWPTSVPLDLSSLTITNFILNGSTPVGGAGLCISTEGNTCELSEALPRSDVGPAQRAASSGDPVVLFKLQHVRFIGNKATYTWGSVGGGAVLGMFDGYNYELIKCEFRGNEAGSGSGIWSPSNSGSANMKESAFIGNKVNIDPSDVRDAGVGSVVLAQAISMSSMVFSGNVVGHGNVFYAPQSFSANVLGASRNDPAPKYVGQGAFIESPKVKIFQAMILLPSNTYLAAPAVSNGSVSMMLGESEVGTSGPHGDLSRNAQIWYRNPFPNSLRADTNVYKTCSESAPFPCEPPTVCQPWVDRQGREMGYSCAVPQL